MKKILLLSLFTLITGSLLHAQTCNNHHRNHCRAAEDPNFKYNGQSKSGLLAKGEAVEFNIIVYKGQDYRISFCPSEEIGQQVKFKIFHETKERVKKEEKETVTQEDYVKCPSCEPYDEGVIEMDGELYKMEMKEVEVVNTRTAIETVKELLYDNTEDEMAQEIEFTIEDTRRLIIEVVVEDDGTGQGGKKLKKLQVRDAGCVGVLVEHQPSAKFGF